MSGNRTHGPFAALFAGGISGVVECCISYPTEYVKTVVQLSKNNPALQTPMRALRTTIKTAGVTGLYRGLSPVIIGSAFKVGVRFYTFELLARQVRKHTGEYKLSPTVNMSCGLLAGISEAIFVTTAMERIKVILVDDTLRPVRRYKGLVRGVSGVIRDNGFATIYKGLLATCLKQGTSQAMRFTIVDGLQRVLYGDLDKTKIPAYATLGCGAVAGAISCMVNNPIDVIKTRMQGITNTGNFLTTLKSLYQEGGFLVFYRGVSPRVVRVMLDASIIFTTYGECIKLYYRLFGR